MALEVEIERLGAQGDGVAEGPDGPIFVTLGGAGVTKNGLPGQARL